MLRGSRRLSCSCKFSYIGYGEPKIWLQPVFSMQRTNSLENILMLGKLKTGGEGDDRGWDGWMASLTWWTWVLASSGSWWWTGKPGVLQSTESQRVKLDWATELNWTVFSQNPSVPFTIICSMFWSVQSTSVIAYAYVLDICNFFDWRVNIQSHTPNTLIFPCGTLLFIILEGSSLPSIPCPCRNDERSHTWHRNFLISLFKVGDNSKMGKKLI